MEENKRKEIFGKVMDMLVDYLIERGLVENKAEALNMLTEYVGKRMLGE